MLKRSSLSSMCRVFRGNQKNNVFMNNFPVLSYSFSWDCLIMLYFCLEDRKNEKFQKVLFRSETQQTKPKSC